MREILPTDLNPAEMQALRAAPAYGALEGLDDSPRASLRVKRLATDDVDPPELTDDGRRLKRALSMGRQIP